MLYFHPRTRCGVRVPGSSSRKSRKKCSRDRAHLVQGSSRDSGGTTSASRSISAWESSPCVAAHRLAPPGDRHPRSFTNLRRIAEVERLSEKAVIPEQRELLMPVVDDTGVSS